MPNQRLEIDAPRVAQPSTLARYNTVYSDDYATCEQTYATVRIYDVDSDHVTNLLGIIPSSSQPGGRISVRGGESAKRPKGWFLSTEGAIESRDVRRHLDWLLDKLMPQRDALAELRRRGATVDICCYWLSASGHGGPTISPAQSAKLAALGIDCWFDVYFTEDDAG